MTHHTGIVKRIYEFHADPVSPTRGSRHKGNTPSNSVYNQQPAQEEEAQKEAQTPA